MTKNDGKKAKTNNRENKNRNEKKQREKKNGSKSSNNQNQHQTSWKKKQTNENNKSKNKRADANTNKSPNNNKTPTNKSKTPNTNKNNNDNSFNLNSRRNRRILNEDQQQLVEQFANENTNQMQALPHRQLQCINLNQTKRGKGRRFDKSHPMYDHQTSSESDSDDDDVSALPNPLHRQLTQHQIESTIVAMQQMYQQQPIPPTNPRSGVNTTTFENEFKLGSNLTSIQPRLQNLQSHATMQTGLNFCAPVPTGAIPTDPIPAAPNIYGLNQNVLQHSIARASTGFMNAATANIPYINIYQSAAAPTGAAKHQ